MASYENKQQTNISDLIYLMRKIVLSALALCCCSVALAQEKTRSLSVELFGAQNLVGINPTCSLYAYNSLILKYRFF